MSLEEITLPQSPLLFTLFYNCRSFFFTCSTLYSSASVDFPPNPDTIKQFQQLLVRLLLLTSVSVSQNSELRFRNTHEVLKIPIFSKYTEHASFSA